MSTDVEGVVNAFYAAIERNDFIAVNKLYSDDLRTWRSFDLVRQNKGEQMTTLSALNSRWSSNYRVTERYFLGEKVIQRHELTMTERNGTATCRLQVAVFLTVHDGQVHVLEEYIDSRDAAQLAAAS